MLIWSIEFSTSLPKSFANYQGVLLYFRARLLRISACSSVIWATHYRYLIFEGRKSWWLPQAIACECTIAVCVLLFCDCEWPDYTCISFFFTSIMFSVCLYATYVVYAVAHALCISPSVFETRLPYIDTSFRIWIPLAQIWYVTSGVRATQTDNR